MKYFLKRQLAKIKILMVRGAILEVYGIKVVFSGVRIGQRVYGYLQIPPVRH